MDEKTEAEPKTTRATYYQSKVLFTRNVFYPVSAIQILLSIVSVVTV